MDRAHVFSVAREAAENLAQDGAEAVVSKTCYCRLKRRGGLLVSTGSRPLESYGRDFGDPGAVCAAVPGWREAVILHDPGGIAASLISDAQEWSWVPLERRCDLWAAERVTALAEEVHKLVAARRRGDRPTAAVQRSLLAVHLVPIMAVHRRILYGSENRLWHLASDSMGEGWRVAQDAALGLHDEPFEETVRAALRLYGLAADEVRDLLDGIQDRVVRHARELPGAKV